MYVSGEKMDKRLIRRCGKWGCGRFKKRRALWEQNYKKCEGV